MLRWQMSLWRTVAGQLTRVSDVSASGCSNLPQGGGVTARVADVTTSVCSNSPQGGGVTARVAVHRSGLLKSTPSFSSIMMKRNNECPQYPVKEGLTMPGNPADVVSDRGHSSSEATRKAALAIPTQVAKQTKVTGNPHIENKTEIQTSSKATKQAGLSIPTQKTKITQETCYLGGALKEVRSRKEENSSGLQSRPSDYNLVRRDFPDNRHPPKMKLTKGDSEEWKLLKNKKKHRGGKKKKCEFLNEELVETPTDVLSSDSVMSSVFVGSNESTGFEGKHDSPLLRPEDENDNRVLDNTIKDKAKSRKKKYKDSGRSQEKQMMPSQTEYPVKEGLMSGNPGVVVSDQSHTSGEETRKDAQVIFNQDTEESHLTTNVGMCATSMEPPREEEVPGDLQSRPSTSSAVVRNPPDNSPLLRSEIETGKRVLNDTTKYITESHKKHKLSGYPTENKLISQAENPVKDGLIVRRSPADVVSNQGHIIREAILNDARVFQAQVTKQPEGIEKAGLTVPTYDNIKTQVTGKYPGDALLERHNVLMEVNEYQVIIRKMDRREEIRSEETFAIEMLITERIANSSAEGHQDIRFFSIGRLPFGCIMVRCMDQHSQEWLLAQDLALGEQRLELVNESIIAVEVPQFGLANDRVVRIMESQNSQALQMRRCWNFSIAKTINNGQSNKLVFLVTQEGIMLLNITNWIVCFGLNQYKACRLPVSQVHSMHLV